MEHEAADAEAFGQSVEVVTKANDEGVPLKLLGGQAVRLLCPMYPHRARVDQDMDFASVSSAKRQVIEFLDGLGFQGDSRFNTLHGDRQMYFRTPDGKVSVDVIVDRLNMCHVLDFRPGYGRLPLTLDAIDILLSKLQIVELNEKDARDTLQLLSGLPVGASRGAASAPFLDTDRFGQLLAADWGWWRTVTGNLDKLPALAANSPHLVPVGARYDPLAQADHLAEVARSVPKGMKWKLRANVGDRVRWYELPEEVGH